MEGEEAERVLTLMNEYKDLIARNMTQLRHVSQVGLGAVLMQRQEDNKLHTVCYFSRKTSKDESKYHSYELQALAIVCALERFRVFLIRIILIIRTDCNSLKLLE